MLHVKTPEEALTLITEAFPAQPRREIVPLSACLSRTLYEDVRADAFVPDFSRSAVDGYAVLAADTFGCTDAMPAILQNVGQIAMGQPAPAPLASGQCAAIPTGGMLPDGADAVQMLEFCEDYGDGTVGIQKPVAPANHVIFRGDDTAPGRVVLPRGRRLRPQDVGALAACGVVAVPVSCRPQVGILSTGDELVPACQAPAAGQMRDVNSMMLEAQMRQYGAETRCCGIVPDQEPLLLSALSAAIQECDIVLVSGGSSVGEKDAAARVLSALGEILFHGIAMQPGKPTLLGRAMGKPVLGLPGHPVAAYHVARLLARPLVHRLLGRTAEPYPLAAVLTESVSANAGRAVYCNVRLERTADGLLAHPVRGKSGLVTALAGADGCFCIPRDREGAAAGETVAVTLFEED